MNPGNPRPPAPRGFEVVQRTAATSTVPAPPSPAARAWARAPVPATMPPADPALFRPGLEESSGRGAVGMTAGVLGGYALSYLYVVPLLGVSKSVETVSLMTGVVMGSMLGLGALGYFLTRRRAR